MCKLAKTADVMDYGSFNVGLSVTVHQCFYEDVPNFAHVMHIPVRLLKINSRKDVRADPFADIIPSISTFTFQ